LEIISCVWKPLSFKEETTSREEPTKLLTPVSEKIFTEFRYSGAEAANPDISSKSGGIKKYDTPTRKAKKVMYVKRTAGTRAMWYFANHLVAGSTEEAITTEVSITKTTSCKKYSPANKTRISTAFKIVPELIVTAIGRSLSII
jgi:hypothetical protein